jgi:hypothetical protein
MAVLNIDFSRMRRDIRVHASSYGVETDRLNSFTFLNDS